MKKLVGIMLMLIIVWTSVGCSNNDAGKKTEEGLKAEIRAQMEAEQAAKNEGGIELEGMLAIQYGPYEVGMTLEEKLDLNGHSVDTLWFNDNEIENYLDRAVFVYTPDGTVIDERFNQSIPVKVMVDGKSLSYDSDLARAYGDVIKVLAIDNKANLVDRRGEDFSVEFYTSVFYDMVYSHCNTSDSVFFTADIKEFDLYKSSEEFRRVVDKILAYGYFIQQAEGDYYINAEEMPYNEDEDGGARVEVSLADLKNGDKVSGLTINNIGYKKGGDTVSFKLMGTTMVVGEIMYDAEYWEAYILNVTDPYLFDTMIKIEMPDNYTVNYTLGTLLFRNEDALLAALSQRELERLKNGEAIGVKISIKDIGILMRYQSEGDTSCDFKEIVDRW